ncbi:MAG: hypothetical protein PHF86_00210 [Candidatus Nanoarchaeia archaeon]|nr:hypothetical protein [Candidatus Nanoarchaeia archaeon]
MKTLIDRKTFETEWGRIDYSYSIPDKNYPTGLLLFLGSVIYKKYRRKGRFKEMVKNLFQIFPQETLIQVALANKKLVPMFERIGFKKVTKIEYWVAASNTVNLEGYLTKEMIGQVMEW